ADAASLESFSDGADVADLAADATSQLIRTGIVQGMTATTFVPQADATRAQGVVMLKRMLQFLQFIDA
ncbi:S-layer homology domain-containing protein, partial [Paenibacillus sepulcri]|nr:S-layer homology domain-containing protein [Paenibacillus sepulcri]